MDRLGIVFSSRMRSALLCVLGVWMCFVMAVVFGEVLIAYHRGRGFDTPASQVLLISFCWLLPYLLVAAMLLRSLAARLALYWQLKRQIIIAHYRPPHVLSPAEAGLLVDDDFTLAEIAATLKDLELRRHLDINETSNGFVFSLHHVADQLSLTEQQFIAALFMGTDTFTTSVVNAPRLLKAGKQLATHTRAQLVAAGLLAPSRSVRARYRIGLRLIIAVALLTQLFLTLSLVFSTKESFTIGTGYPMYISEPLVVIGLFAGSVAVITSGFWRRALGDDHGLKNWRYVAGLKLYLEKVYKGRFYRGRSLTVTRGELRAFYPYAIALGVERDFTAKLKRALFL